MGGIPLQPIQLPPSSTMTPLQEFDLFCQNQILRLQKQLQLPQTEGEPTPTNQDVAAFPVRHAVGRRKPSLEQLELEGISWFPTPPKWSKQTSRF